jgi:hypothetical protein
MDSKIRQVFLFMGSKDAPGSELKDLVGLFTTVPKEELIAELVRKRMAELPARKWYQRAKRIDWVSMLICFESSYSTNTWHVLHGKDVSVVRWLGVESCKLPWQDAKGFWHGVVLSSAGYPPALI